MLKIKKQTKWVAKRSLAIMMLVGWIGLTSVIFYEFADKAQAAVKNAGVLEISYPGVGPLFSIDNAAPGMNEPRTVTIKNNGSKAHSLSIATQGSLGSLAAETIIETRNTTDNSLIWSKKLNAIAAFPNSTQILSSIDPGATAQIDIIAILPTSLDNNYQNTSTLIFDFIVGNEDTDENEDGGGGGGTTDGIDRTTNDGGGTDGTANGDTDDTATSGVDSATGSETNAQPELPAGIGGGAEGLTLRTSRGAAVGQEPVDDPADTIRIADFTQGEVLGVSANNGEVKSASCATNLWWWILLLILAVVLVIYGFFVRYGDRLWKYVPPIIAALAIYLIYLIINKDCCTESIWCKYFWLIDLLILITYSIIVSLFKIKEKKLAEDKIIPPIERT